MDFTITISDLTQLAGLQRVLAERNAMSNDPLTEERLIQEFVQDYLANRAQQYMKLEVSRKDFLLRFTSVERVAIREKAKTDPYVYDYLELLNSVDVVHLQDPATIGGVTVLTSAGLLAEGRSDQILSLFG